MTKSETTRTISIGDHMPSWHLPALAGTEFHLDTLCGTRVLLFIWGSW